ncbi:MAG: alpha/beta fold hydrolase [Gammaproteobacteria bacterium]
MRRFLLPLLAIPFSVLLTAPAWADHARTVEARLASGKFVTADYHAGKRDRPTVLLLHGFLQTREFPTVAGLQGVLSMGDYTVLAPTLSLGISRRNRSLPCEAVHLHTLQEDAGEVAFWVRWLQRQGHHNIVLAGHSFGSVQLLAYLAQSPSPAVKRALMISLSDVEVKQGAAQRAQLATALRERVAEQDRSLAEAELGHCRKYVGPPAAVLSYLDVTRESMLRALTQSPVPVTAIMGSKDDRMGPDWIGTLRARGIDVHMIEGASHFFDNQYEFDLQDTVLQALQEK